MGASLEEVEFLLAELCTKLGYCISADQQARLRRNPPEDVETFVDAVLAAEGFDPSLVGKAQRRKIAEMVRKRLLP